MSSGLHCKRAARVCFDLVCFFSADFANSKAFQTRSSIGGLILLTQHLKEAGVTYFADVIAHFLVLVCLTSSITFARNCGGKLPLWRSF
jgi:hypothetical protein